MQTVTFRQLGSGLLVIALLGFVPGCGGGGVQPGMATGEAVTAPTMPPEPAGPDLKDIAKKNTSKDITKDTKPKK